MFVVGLSDAIHFDPSIIGSKAMNLSKMKQVVPSIPDGFIITSNAFQRFLIKNQIDISHSPKEVQREILSSPFPKEIVEEIKMFFTELNKKRICAVAVRSSSALEDLEGASFAGQYETILNIKTINELFQNVKVCWASYFSSYVREYADRNDISLAEVKMGVFVQGMIAADVSGVIFSSNPVTHNQAEILINASYGLGEAIVNGDVTPDMFIINKENLMVISEELGDKDIQIVPNETGCIEVDVPLDKQQVFCLTENQVLELAKQTKIIEAYYQMPVDIEFAIKDNEIHILQSRPITTLKGEVK